MLTIAAALLVNTVYAFTPKGLVHWLIPVDFWLFATDKTPRGANKEVPVGTVLEITAWREVYMETQGAESGCRPSTDAGETTNNGLTRRLLQSVL